MPVSAKPEFRPSAAKSERSPDVVAIEAALHGPVIEILVDNIPSLQKIERERVYFRIIGNPVVAASCFKLFRDKPELFRSVLLRADGRPAAGDDEMLACGRTLAQVISLIVRAVAKRYFRSRLNARPKPPPPPQRVGLLRSLMGFAAERPAPSRPRPGPDAARGDELYAALREFLLFEWQVALVPHYVPLPVATVRALGARILDFREPAELSILAGGGPEASGLIERLRERHADKIWTEIVGPRDAAPKDVAPWEYILSRSSSE